MTCAYCDTSCTKCGLQVASGDKPDYPGGECSNCHFGLTSEGPFFPTKKHLDDCDYCKVDSRLRRTP